MATPHGLSVKFSDLEENKARVKQRDPVDHAESSDKDAQHRQPPKNIFEAAERGAVGWIVKLAERTLDFDVNQRDRLARTPLHWAAEAGHIEVIEALLDYGSDVKLTECNGRTAIHLASRGGHHEALKVLLENKSQAEIDYFVNQPDNIGITPVFLALQRGDEKSGPCFEYLMMCGARYNTNGTTVNPFLNSTTEDAPKPPATTNA